MQHRLIIGFVVLFASASFASAAEAPLYPTEDCSKEVAQMAINACTQDNLDAANSALNGLYRKVMAHLADPQAKEQLKQTERAWVAAKDKACKTEAAEDEGGSIQAMDYNLCEIGKTDARIGELEKMAGCTGSASACNPK